MIYTYNDDLGTITSNTDSKVIRSTEPEWNRTVYSLLKGLYKYTDMVKYPMITQQVKPVKDNTDMDDPKVFGETMPLEQGWRHEQL